MKKISLKGIKETLSEKELKNVMGGSLTGCDPTTHSVLCTGGCLTAYGAGTCMNKWFDLSGSVCACVV